MTDQQPVPGNNDGAKAVPPKGTKSLNKTLLIILAVIAVIVILPAVVFAGGAYWLSRGDNVSKLTENVIEKASGDKVKIDRDGESINIKTEDGSISAGAKKELPKDFPSSVPLYDNQVIEGSITNSIDKQKSWYITASSEKPVQEISDYLEYKLTDWKTVSSSSMDDMLYSSYTKDNYTLSLTISPDSSENRSTITYTVVEEIK